MSSQLDFRAGRSGLELAGGGPGATPGYNSCLLRVLHWYSLARKADTPARLWLKEKA
jgi:hypothetical protein